MLDEDYNDDVHYTEQSVQQAQGPVHRQHTKPEG